MQGNHEWVSEFSLVLQENKILGAPNTDIDVPCSYSGSCFGNANCVASVSLSGPVGRHIDVVVAPRVLPAVACSAMAPVPWLLQHSVGLWTVHSATSPFPLAALSLPAVGRCSRKLPLFVSTSLCFEVLVI